MAIIAPVFLSLLGAAGILYGFMSDDTGFIILGAISIAVALLNLFSRYAMRHRDDPDGD